jgi:selenide,water dikinase
VLRRLPRVESSDLLLGDNPADDAAVYRVREDLALVQSVDFFTPIVDDPYTYGQIAAANSLSDIYAVGGTPLTALNVVGFPVKSLSRDILAEILRGGATTAAEAGLAIVGGHTVDDEEPKYGLAVTGTIDPRRLITPRGARAGELLVLTKPLGTGVISTAIKQGAVAPAVVEHAVRWMLTLNRDASRAMVAAGASACTDITGFGLLGHLADLCAASGVSARLKVSAIPILPFALDCARAGHVPGGTVTNLESARSSVDLSEVDEDARLILADPQTSGGLLVALEPSTLETFRRSASRHMLVAVIGELEGRDPGRIRVLA